MKNEAVDGLPLPPLRGKTTLKGHKTPKTRQFCVEFFGN